MFLCSTHRTPCSRSMHCVIWIRLQKPILFWSFNSISIQIWELFQNNSDLIGQNGYSFGYVGALKWWNQLTPKPLLHLGASRIPFLQVSMSSQLTQLHEKINQPGNYLNNVINYYRFVLVESQPVTDPRLLFCWNHAENHNVLKLINIIIIVLLLLQG